jgi:YHS domain-containing protein
MKKEIFCNKCNGKVGINYYCDTCSNNLITKYYGIPITIEFSYGHNLDGTEYHFCDYQCLLQFISEELKKQQPKGEER